MIFKTIKAWTRTFRLNNFVNSALRNGIIVSGDDGVSGIDKNVFEDYIDMMQQDIKDEFVDRIVNSVIESRMNSEINSSNREEYVEKIKDYVVFSKNKEAKEVIGAFPFRG